MHTQLTWLALLDSQLEKKGKDMLTPTKYFTQNLYFKSEYLKTLAEASVSLVPL
jgi:hypothetical protein